MIFMINIGNRISRRSIQSGLTNQILASQSSDFVYHSKNYRPNWTPLSPLTIINIGNRTLRRSIQSGLTNQTPASRSSDFVYHSYSYRPNWTPLSLITIRNGHAENKLQLRILF